MVKAMKKLYIARTKEDDLFDKPKREYKPKKSKMKWG